MPEPEEEDVVVADGPSGGTPYGRLRVARVADLEPQPASHRWLIHDLWLQQAVGCVGGLPKIGKSWLGLDMAVSVASGTPCLGAFSVDEPGRALVFLAEDALPTVRARIGAIAAHRSLPIADLDLHVITECEVRLDVEWDRKCLWQTVADMEPRLLLLDPFVRLHRLNENSATDVSGLLGFLRSLQRAFGVAVVLVHHHTKSRRATPGENLRGSGDVWAFGDSNLSLTRKGKDLLLTMEHRSARPAEPVPLRLAQTEDDAPTHLELAAPAADDAAPQLAEQVMELLRETGRPLSGTALRTRLRVNNQRLWHALVQLQAVGAVERSPRGWTAVPQGSHAAERNG